MKSKEPPMEVETPIGNDLIRVNRYSKDGGYIGTFTEKGLKKYKEQKKGKKNEPATKKKRK